MAFFYSCRFLLVFSADRVYWIGDVRPKTVILDHQPCEDFSGVMLAQTYVRLISIPITLLASTQIQASTLLVDLQREGPAVAQSFLLPVHSFGVKEAALFLCRLQEEVKTEYGIDVDLSIFGWGRLQDEVSVADLSIILGTVGVFNHFPIYFERAVF